MARTGTGSGSVGAGSLGDVLDEVGEFDVTDGQPLAVVSAQRDRHLRQVQTSTLRQSNGQAPSASVT